LYFKLNVFVHRRELHSVESICLCGAPLPWEILGTLLCSTPGFLPTKFCFQKKDEWVNDSFQDVFIFQKAEGITTDLYEFTGLPQQFKYISTLISFSQEEFLYLY